MDKKGKDKPGEGGRSDGSRPPTRSRVIASAIGQFDTKPELLADALRTILGDDGVRTLAALLDG
jgi:ParB family chromosome partitioning protein